MKYYLERWSALEGKFVKFPCTLHIANGRFTVYPIDRNFTAIVLGDGVAHNLDKIEGTVVNLFIDGSCVSLEGCFVNIDGKWHQDGLSFFFEPTP